MARKWFEIPQEYPDIIVGHLYSVRVIKVEKNRSPRGICITVQHLSQDQDGRRHSFILPLPIHPEGITAEFFRACGTEIVVGHKFAPQKDAMGAEINIAFTTGVTNDGLEPVAFKPISKENSDET